MIAYKFETILQQILSEEAEPDYTSAVGIVQNKDRWLVGLARNTGDGRSGKWCHPGGGIKNNESPEKAAEREVFEETGIKCKAKGKAFRMQSHKGVAFVHCKVTGTPEINPNEEFSAIGLFTMDELRALKPMYKNVLKLIEMVKD
jgi:8-oxo-dGTP pyrophosphatase MutT (NUDIX family)